MRVITGTARGRRLKAPENNSIRPTSDMVKESIFDIIQFSVQDANVLDLFAGTGQLGIEALSRGAKFSTFVDNSNAAIKIVKENIENCLFLEKSKVVFSSAPNFINSTNEKFDIIFLDPPYNKNILQDVLPEIRKILTENAIIICEHDINEKIPEEFQGLYLKKRYKYGKIGLSVFLAS